MEEVPTHDGGGHRVLTLQEQASSTVVELVNHGIAIQEEEPTINVCQIQNCTPKYGAYTPGVQNLAPILIWT